MASSPRSDAVTSAPPSREWSIVPESVEQAALRRATETRIDWQARAVREAAAILDALGADVAYVAAYRRDTLIKVLAIAWLQGATLGLHETLAAAEVAFENARAAL